MAKTDDKADKNGKTGSAAPLSAKQLKAYVDPFRFDGNHADTLTALYGSMPPVTNHTTSPAMSTKSTATAPKGLAPGSPTWAAHLPSCPQVRGWVSLSGGCFG